MRFQWSFRISIVCLVPSSMCLHSSSLHMTVTFHNTHSIFADIIQAEMFEPNLSNSIPNTSHISMHSCAIPAIPTFSEPSVRILHTILQPCLQLLHSITLALIVSNCPSSSCCIMICDIASHAPSICSFQVLSSFFVHP